MDLRVLVLLSLKTFDRAEGPMGQGSTDAERGEGGRRCVSACATLKSKHSSGDSVAVEVGCVPEGLARCTQDCSPGTVSKSA